MVEGLLLSGAELPPAVVDADGLNTLARIPEWWERWPSSAVLTPHPGEMARLTGGSGGSSRLDSALAAAARWNKTVVLKGAHTVVAHPERVRDGLTVRKPRAGYRRDGRRARRGNRWAARTSAQRWKTRLSSACTCTRSRERGCAGR